MLYVDTSALVKLVVSEPQSSALRRWLKAHEDRRVTSELTRVELVRAIRAADANDAVMADALSLFDGLALIPISRAVLESAAELTPASLRTLDAIHLASALLLGPQTLVLTYDDRLAAAARAHRLDVVAPT